MLKIKPIEEIKRSDMDTPWKNIMNRYFRGFMEYCLPEIAGQVNWKKGYEMFDKELNMITRGAKIGNRVADKLVKVWTKNGQETWILTHLEVQGKKELFFPERMFIYRARFRDFYKKPVISIAILIDGNPNWRPDRFQENFYGCSLEMQYIIVKLLDYKKKRQELEKMTEPFAAVILAQLAVLEAKKDPETRLKTKITLTRKLYEKGWGKEDILELYALIDWLIELPKELELEYNKAIEQIEEKKQMRYITTAERIGLAKGRGEGFHEGGMALLIRLLKRRFTSVPKAYLERLQQADNETLFTLGEKVLSAETLEDVFA